MTGFVLVLEPAEAAEIVPGWPGGAWLVAASDPAGAASWDACGPEGVADLCAGLPAWPPSGRMPWRDPGPDEEMELLVRLGAEKGLGAEACARMALPAADAPLDASDMEW